MQSFYSGDIDVSANGYPIIGLNSLTLAVVDGVFADANGFLALASVTSKILGFSTGDESLASDNQTVAKVKPLYSTVLGVKLVYGADQDATQTDIGAYADYGTITSGAQEINLVAGGTGQFLVLGFNPYDNDNDDEVVVEVAEPQSLAFAQA